MIAIGLDLGTKRIGVAVSDALGLFAHPRPPIVCSKGEQPKKLVELALAERPEEVIIGYPLELSGVRGETAIWAEKFCDKLRGHFSAYPELKGVKLKLWDERLSSVQAERELSIAGHFGAKAKSMTDSLAAVIILESYLSSKVKDIR
jgi:putative Holliday junction resolvase